VRGARVVAVGDAGTVVESLDGGKRFTATEVGGVNLHGVWIGDDGALAVGARGAVARGVAGEPWLLLESPTDADLRAVSGAGGEAIAVGARGTVLVARDGRRFEPVAAPTAADLLAVTGGPADALIAGERGTLLRGLVPEESGSRNALTGVWRGGGREIVVGAGGTVLAWSIRGPTEPDGRGPSSARSDEGVGRQPMTEERRGDATEIGRQATEVRGLARP
jgi:hypothetical protein